MEALMLFEMLSKMRILESLSADFLLKFFFFKVNDFEKIALKAQNWVF